MYHKAFSLFFEKCTTYVALFDNPEMLFWPLPRDKTEDGCFLLWMFLSSEHVEGGFCEMYFFEKKHLMIGLMITQQSV